MATETLTDFDQQYLETWTEPDAERLRAPDGRLEISPAGLTLEGTDAIAEHVGRVHEQNIAGRGMRFQYDQHAEAGDALLLRWSMLAPDGSVVGRGVDLVFRGPDG